MWEWGIPSRQKILNIAKKHGHTPTATKNRPELDSGQMFIAEAYLFLTHGRTMSGAIPLTDIEVCARAKGILDLDYFMTIIRRIDFLVKDEKDRNG